MSFNDGKLERKLKSLASFVRQKSGMHRKLKKNLRSLVADATNDHDSYTYNR